MNTVHKLENWLTWVDQLSDRNYVVIDDFLTDSHYELIRSFFLQKQEAFEQAGIGAHDANIIAKNIRGDLTYWLDSQRDNTLQPFWQLVDETVHIFNRYCFLSLSGFEFHLAHYPRGGHYDRHLDQFAGRNNRMISMVIYLNEGWTPGDGGELELEDADGNIHLVAPVGKRCVLFKSAEVPNAVRLAHKDRYSLTGWLLYHPAAVGTLLY